MLLTAKWLFVKFQAALLNASFCFPSLAADLTTQCVNVVKLQDTPLRKNLLNALLFTMNLSALPVDRAQSSPKMVPTAPLLPAAKLEKTLQLPLYQTKMLRVPPFATVSQLFCNCFAIVLGVLVVISIT